MVDLDRASSTGNTSGTLSSERFLSLYVIATTDRGTEAALAAARAYAGDLNGRVVLLVPHVVPYVQPLEYLADSPTLGAKRFCQMAAALGLDITIRVGVCRSTSAMVALLPREAVVLVGGHRRWWRTREERLVNALTRRGFRALFVDSARALLARSTSNPAA